ncbi:DNA cytosine methyltransferase [Streptomyces sp. NPDC102360]|uniref:DNA cytosine methyltransferase n=1 Tax=Streptomyces sp. NPDC102360 TaxID=3366160 RepID=UPI003828FF48
MPATETLTLGSLFTGVGGLDLAVLSVLGGRTAWHAETDPAASTVLAHHMPGIPNHGDVRTIDWTRVEPVDVLTAGFPCQSLSVAGPRTGLTEGTRSSLWHHAVTAIDQLRPPLVVIENVHGILSTRAGADSLRGVEPCPRCLGDPGTGAGMRALGAVLGSLADLRYNTAWGLFRASDVGAPHQRARVILVATPHEATVLHEATVAQDADGEPGHQRRLPAPGQTQSGRPRPHPRRRSRIPAAHPAGQRRSERVAESALPQWRPHSGLHGCRPDRCRAARGAAAAHTDHVGRHRRCRYDPETSRRHEPANCRHSPTSWWGEYAPAVRRWEHVTGRPAPSPTIEGTRRLAAEFVEWMMLPQGWVTAVPGLSRAARLRLLGNSVVPAQAAHALTHLLHPTHARDSVPQPAHPTTGPCTRTVVAGPSDGERP